MKNISSKKWIGLLLLIAMAFLVVGCASTEDILEAPASEIINAVPDGAPEGATGTNDAAVSGPAPGQAPPQILNEDLGAPRREELPIAQGFGGDGGYAESVASEYYGDPLMLANFKIEVAFPEAPASMNLSVQNDPYQNPTAAPEAIAEIARKFGFEGTAYTESYGGGPFGEPGFKDDHASIVMFSGEGRLTSYAGNIDIQFEQNYGPSNTVLPESELIRLTETYLNERGLLDFPHKIRRNWGSDVVVYPIIDGYFVDRPIFNLVFSSEGKLMYLNYTPLNDWPISGSVTPLSAETVWEQALAKFEGGDYYEDFYFNVIPSDAQLEQMSKFEGRGNEYMGWERLDTSNSDTSMMAWLSMFVAYDGSGETIIMANGTRISAEPTILNELQNVIGQSVLLQGQTETTPNGERVFHVTQWEIGGEFEGGIFLSGKAVRDGSQLYLQVNGGQRFLIPDAPADVPDGENIFIDGWGIRDVGTGIPVFEWNHIESNGGRLAEPTFEEPYYEDPYQFSEVTITSIELVYTPVYRGDPASPAGIEMRDEQMVFVPKWRFSGTTDSGAYIELIINAVPTQ